MITPPCLTPGCKQPSVHRVIAPWTSGLYADLAPWKALHFCVPCFAAYERKVWGKA